MPTGKGRVAMAWEVSHTSAVSVLQNGTTGYHKKIFQEAVVDCNLSNFEASGTAKACGRLVSKVQCILIVIIT